MVLISNYIDDCLVWLDQVLILTLQGLQIDLYKKVNKLLAIQKI